MACVAAASATTPPTTLVDETNHDHNNKEDEDDDDEVLMCIVCWEQTTTDNDHNNNRTRPATLALPCGHTTCRPCAVSWMERCEMNGQDEATCPHCRAVLCDDTVRAVLGRPFERQTPVPEDVVIDDFTQVWLDDHDAQECPNCHMTMVQEDDDRDQGDDSSDVPGIATACPCCGFVYCWKCHEAAEDCDCDTTHFYDYTTDQELRMSDVDDFPVATAEDLEDLAAFRERRQRVIRGEEDMDDEEQVEPEQVEPETAELVALFARSAGCVGTGDGHSHTTDCLGGGLCCGQQQHAKTNKKEEETTDETESNRTTATMTTGTKEETQEEDAGAELVGLFARSAECGAGRNEAAHHHTTDCLC